ncbi:MAG: YkgJ family cysteine cluster protein [Acidobacteriota bacterium]
MTDAPTREAILKDYERLKLNDRFTFRCGKDLKCFTQCCKDVAIVLTPYDVLRLKRNLRMDSTEFLDKYTIVPFTKDQKIPVVLLKMEGEDKHCPFVSADGCGVYDHRPWACRMYPLGLAEPRNPNPEEGSFHFLLKEDLCHGHGEGGSLTVREWIVGQGIEDYDRMGVSFKALMLEEFWEKLESLPPEKMEMYYTALYDLDRFRRFLFESSFLRRFQVNEERLEVMKTDDEELLEFGIQWLRFILLGEKTMRLRPEVVEAEKAKAAARAAEKGKA